MQLAEAEREQKRAAFERALSMPDEPPVSDSVALDDMPVEEGYSGPRMEGERDLGAWLVCAYIWDGREPFVTITKMLPPRCTAHHAASCSG